MSTANPPAAAPSAFKSIVSGLDASLHVSTRRGVMSKAMSSRRLVNNKNDDLVRSGSTRQLLNRPAASSSTMGGLSMLAPIPAGPAPPAGAAESLATEETAEDDMSESEGSVFSGGSFCDADGDQAPDQDYLTKDLGASLHDDELEIDGDANPEGADAIIEGIKNRMKIEGGPGSKVKKPDPFYEDEE